jgi:serine protease Do
MKKKAIYVIVLINSLILFTLLIYFIFDNINNKSSNKIFNENINSIVEVKASTIDVGESYGSGVIYDKSGLIITNAHVVTYTKLSETKVFDLYEIRFADEEDYQGVTLIKYDIDIDLAILKIDDNSVSYKPIKFSSSSYTYGDKVYAIGNTSNYGIGISEGIISVPEVNIFYNNVSRVVIQANIDIASGNSGGALVNKKGHLIGLTTFRTKDNNGNVNYGFAYSIPIKIINNYISEK